MWKNDRNNARGSPMKDRKVIVDEKTYQKLRQLREQKQLNSNGCVTFRSIISELLEVKNGSSN